MKRSKKGLIIGICALVLVVLGGLIAWILLSDDAIVNPEDPNHTHAYATKEILREATCTEDGILLQKCSCGKQQLKMETATGHKLGEWQTKTEADCKTTGVAESVCTTCGHTVTQTIPRTLHRYELAEKEEEQEKSDYYKCTVCSDSFTVNNDIEMDIFSHPFVSDCDENYIFQVYCDQGSNYIYEHLRIVDSYFYGTEHEKSLPYTVSKRTGNWWNVIPQKPYEAGGIYLALRSGQVFFQENCIQNLTFAIHRDETQVVELAENVVFLQKLENKKGGYYPYTLEFSEETDTYWLTTQKADKLEEGDIICVGNATSLDEVMQQDKEPDVFGKIKSINYNKETKTYLIELVEPSLSEVFSKLDVHSSQMTAVKDVETVSKEELAEQAKSILFQSEDFANFICSAHVTSLEYLTDRGLRTPLASLKDFFESIEISDEDTYLTGPDEDGVLTGKVTLNGEIEIPIELSNGDQVGNIRIYFEASVEINPLKIIIDVQSKEVQIEDAEQITLMQAGVDQHVTTSFTFGVELQMDWSLESKPYVLNTKTGTYHFHTCRHVTSVKDQSSLQEMSAETMFEKLGEGEITEDKECKVCLPLTSMKEHHYALHTKNKKVHVYGCSLIARTKAPTLEISEMPLNKILEEGYTKCESCNPGSESANSFAVQMLAKMQSEDLTDSLKQYKEIAEKIGNEDTAKMLKIGGATATVGGIAAVEVELFVYFDFNLEASLEYNYELYTRNQYGVYLTQTGFQGYSDSEKETKENSITLTGKVRVDVGVAPAVNVHVIGLEKYCYACLEARLGLYAELLGALKYDFLNTDAGFAAAYFEAGLHCDLLFSARLASAEIKDHSFMPEDMQDIPFLKYGYDRVYTNFAEMPETILLDSIYFNLEKVGLKVKYYDIFEMSDGTDELSVTGIRDKYEVTFSLADGTHCTVDSGYVLIHTPNEPFEDELTITVSGYDDWGKYRKGNTKYDMEPYTIKIEYDPLRNIADIPEEAVYLNGHYYYLYSLKDITSIEQAKEHCESLGGYLCTITSEAEEAFITEYLLNQGAMNNIAFGLEFDADAGVWRWDNGEKMAYTDWVGEAPENGNVGVLSNTNEDYSWYSGGLDSAQTEGLLVLCEWGIYADYDNMTTEEKLDNLTGFYQGWYTASQGKTGITLGIHRTNGLLQDTKALEKYAQWATECSKNYSGKITKTYTVDDIIKYVEAHEDEYIAIFMFGPLRENPDVEDGIYTMSVAYDEEANTYSLVGKTWIQRDTYVFVDYVNTVLYGDVIQGDVYSDDWGYSKCGEFFLTVADDVIERE